MVLKQSKLRKYAMPWQILSPGLVILPLHPEGGVLKLDRFQKVLVCAHSPDESTTKHKESMNLVFANCSKEEEIYPSTKRIC